LSNPSPALHQCQPFQRSTTTFQPQVICRPHLVQTPSHQVTYFRMKENTDWLCHCSLQAQQWIHLCLIHQLTWGFWQTNLVNLRPQSRLVFKVIPVLLLLSIASHGMTQLTSRKPLVVGHSLLGMWIISIRLWSYPVGIPFQ
jgi:hypothetical protein